MLRAGLSSPRSRRSCACMANCGRAKCGRLGLARVGTQRRAEKFSRLRYALFPYILTGNLKMRNAITRCSARWSWTFPGITSPASRTMSSCLVRPFGCSDHALPAACAANSTCRPQPPGTTTGTTPTSRIQIVVSPSTLRPDPDLCPGRIDHSLPARDAVRQREARRPNHPLCLCRR